MALPSSEITWKCELITVGLTSMKLDQVSSPFAGDNEYRRTKYADYALFVSPLADCRR